MDNFYTVTIEQDGKETVSRYFSTIAAAQKWARWLASAGRSPRLYRTRGETQEQVVIVPPRTWRHWATYEPA